MSSPASRLLWCHSKVNFSGQVVSQGPIDERIDLNESVDCLVREDLVFLSHDSDHATHETEKCQGLLTLSPEATERVFAVATLLTLQVMSLDVTSLMGLLFGGDLM